MRVVFVVVFVVFALFIDLLTDKVQPLSRSVMEQLVDDIMDDPFVKHLVQDMPPSKTPFFVQLNEQAKASSGGVEYGNLGTGESKQESKQESTTLDDEDVLGDLNGGGGRGGRGGRGGMQEADKNQLLQHGGTQELISRIMENTFFNLISEVAHGEINLNVEPRTMVQVSENAK